MRGRSLLLPGAAVLLVLLEFAAYKRGGAFTVVASRLWALHGILFLGVSLLVLGRHVADELRGRRLLGVLALAWLSWLAFFPLTSTRRLAINADGTQQVAAGIENLRKPDLGYTETAFLGYPSRQYLPLAVPPAILGRSVLALRLGAAILVLLGFSVFAAGVKALLGSEDGSDVASLSVLALATFPYVAVQLPFYDQTVLPFAFVCLAAGWLALCDARFTIPRFLSAIWAIAMLGTGYTPGLAPWLFFLLLLLLQAARRWSGNRKEALAWAAGALWAAGIGACSFLTRIDFHATRDASPFQADALARVGKTTTILLFGDPVFFWSPLWMLPILVLLLLALFWRQGLLGFLVAAWSFGVVYAATQLRGYMVPTVEFALHRAIVVVPPVVALLALQARAANFGKSRWRTASTWIAAVLMAVFSWNLFSRSWRSSIPPSAREAFVRDVERQRTVHGWGSNTRFAIGLLTRQADLVNAEVLAGYFWPSARIMRSESALESAVREERNFLVYGDRPTGLPGWIAEIAGSREDVDLHGPSWKYEMVRAAGSTPEKWLEARGALPEVETSTISIEGRPVLARYTSADTGQIQDLFDGDWLTLLRTRSATTAIVDLEFQEPRSLRGVSVWTATMSVGLRVYVYGASEAPVSFDEVWREERKDPRVELRFPSRQEAVRRIRLEITNLQGGDGHIHLREVGLLD